MIEIVRRHPTQRLSQLVTAGEFVFLAGQTAPDVSQDAAGQTRQILQKLDRLLGEAGSSRSDLVWCILFLSDMRDRDMVNAVWGEWIDPAALPARTSVEARLALPGYRIEITAIAVRRS